MSPIAGLTRRQDARPNQAIPTIGKLRKGAPKGEKRPGRDLDYFRLDLNPEYLYLEEEFCKLYGNEPKEFTVKLIGKSVDDVFPSWYEAHNTTTLLHKCDGETQVVHWNDKQGGYNNNPTPCIDPANNVACGCSRIGRLNFILPEFTDRTNVMGKFVIETHSVYDLIKIFNQLLFLEETFGTLMYLPCIVGRAPQERSYTGQNGKRAKKEYSLLYIKYYVPLLKSFMEPQFDNESLLQEGDRFEDEGEILSLPATAQTEEITQPEETQSTASQTKQEEIKGINPEAIAGYIQNKLDTNITAQDVIEAFKLNKFNWLEATANYSLYAYALVLEYWYQSPDGETLMLEDFTKAVASLFSDKQAQDYIIKIVLGDPE